MCPLFDMASPTNSYFFKEIQSYEMKEFQLSVLLHGIWASDRARVENTSTLVSIRSRK